MRISIRVKLLASFFIMSLLVFALSCVALFSVFRENTDKNLEAELKSAMQEHKNSFDDLFRKMKRYGHYMRFNKSIIRLLSDNVQDSLGMKSK